MNISHKTSHNIHTITLEGAMDNNALKEVQAYARPLIDEAKQLMRVPGIILDVSKVDYITSAGIGFLCAQHVAFKKLEKKFILCNPTGMVWNAIQTSSLNSVLLIYPDKFTALNELIASVR